MKKISLAIWVAIIVTGCANKKAEKKAIINQVLKIHDKVMSDDEQLMNNKMLLDSIIKHNSTPSNKDSAGIYLAQVSLADSMMVEWMHKFDPEQTGKTDDDKIAYFNTEKKKVIAIDSQMTVALTQSDKYLAKLKKK